MTLDEFLDLPWSDNTRHVLRVRADRDDVLALTASYTPKLTAMAWTELPDAWPPDAIAVWVKPGKQSKTLQALALMEQRGLSAYAAAKLVGINASAVSRALARRAGRKPCPHCGQLMKGQSVD